MCLKDGAKPVQSNLARHWSLAVFASRETCEVLHNSVLATMASADAAGVLVTIDVLINGNSSLATAMTKRLVGTSLLNRQSVVRIWDLPLGDKAHAWNEYFSRIWSGESLAFFTDGYVKPHQDAIRLLGHAVMSDTVALGGSGAPSIGRTARNQRTRMLAEGGMQGNFCCIKGDTIAELKKRNIKLPVGLYRTDSLVSTMLAFGLDPLGKSWNQKRILVCPDVSWINDYKNWWNAGHVTDQLKRVLRQARGMLETAAIKNHFSARRRAPELLPGTASELVVEWKERCTDEFRDLIRRHPLCFYAMKHFDSPPANSAAYIAPRLVWTSNPA